MEAGRGESIPRYNPTHLFRPSALHTLSYILPPEMLTITTGCCTTRQPVFCLPGNVLHKERAGRKRHFWWRAIQPVSVDREGVYDGGVMSLRRE